MEFTQEQKKQIEKMIVNTSIDALEAGAIQEAELQEIAKFVLLKIDAIKTEAELVVFLEELAVKWKFFLPIERFLEGEIKHEEEQKFIVQAEDLAKTGHVDEALAAIRQAER